MEESKVETEIEFSEKRARKAREEEEEVNGLVTVLLFDTKINSIVICNSFTVV